MMSVVRKAIKNIKYLLNLELSDSMIIFEISCH